MDLPEQPCNKSDNFDMVVTSCQQVVPNLLTTCDKQCEDNLLTACHEHNDSVFDRSMAMSKRDGREVYVIVPKLK